MKKQALIFLVTSLFFSAAFADNLIIKDAWARPAYGKIKNSAIYMEVKNNTAIDEFVTAVSSSVSNITEIHKTIDNNGISEMIPINKLAIPARSVVSFTPGGLHIMLIKLNKELNVGDKFQLELTLEKEGKKVITVEVKEPK